MALPTVHQAIATRWATDVTGGLSIPTRWSNVWSGDLPALRVHALVAIEELTRVPSVLIGDGKGHPRSSCTLTADLFSPVAVGENAIITAAQAISDVFDGLRLLGITGVRGALLFGVGLRGRVGQNARQQWQTSVTIPFTFDQE